MKNILILDDDITILKAMKRQLNSEYNVYTAKNIEEASSILDNLSDNIPVVIVDYNLQDELTGIDYAKRLNDKFPLTQTILFTGEKSVDTVINALNCGAIQSFISKPIQSQELRSRVKESFEIWSDKKRLVDELLELDYNGSELHQQQLNVIGLTEKSYKKIRNQYLQSKDDQIYGLVISKGADIIYSHFLDNPDALKDSDLFANLVESVCRLNVDIFVETHSYRLEELNLMNTSILIRSMKGLNFMLFVDGHPKNKLEFQIKMDLLINEIAHLIPTNSTGLTEDLSSQISYRLNHVG